MTSQPNVLNSSDPVEVEEAPEKPHDPFAYSRRLLREAEKLGDDLGGIDNRAAGIRMARACRED